MERGRVAREMGGRDGGTEDVHGRILRTWRLTAERGLPHASPPTVLDTLWGGRGGPGGETIAAEPLRAETLVRPLLAEEQEDHFGEVINLSKCAQVLCIRIARATET